MQSKRLPQPEEYFSYDRLEKASKKLHLNPTVPENEERLMNLHNHLILFMSLISIFWKVEKGGSHDR